MPLSPKGELSFKVYNIVTVNICLTLLSLSSWRGTVLYIFNKHLSFHIDVDPLMSYQTVVPSSTILSSTSSLNLLSSFFKFLNPTNPGSDKYIFSNRLSIQHTNDAVTIPCIMLAMRNHDYCCSLLIKISE